MSRTDPLLGKIPGSEHQEIGGVQIDVVRAANARVKRSVYPVGFQWSRDIKPHVGTETCTHAHVGFLARGQIHMEFPDGCTLEFAAPQVVVIEPGHAGVAVYVLNMGQPVRIVELAENLITLSGLRPGHDIKIEFVGVRPGEKLCEELSALNEDTRPTYHEKIKIFVGPSSSLSEVAAQMSTLSTLCTARDLSGVIKVLREMVPQYDPSEVILSRLSVRTALASPAA